MSGDELARRALRLEWLLFDVDGVLTDGRLHYSEQGETVKAFHARDGLGFRLAQRAGLKLGLLSGRRSPALETRARELDFDCLLLASSDKASDLDAFLAEHATTAEKTAFVGDDLPDLPVLGRCGLAFAPADAVPEVRAAAHLVLRSAGGQGAAREMIERILKARGQWEGLVDRFRRRPSSPAAGRSQSP